MNKHTFFLAAVLLAFVALIAQCVARGFMTEAMHRRAAGIALAKAQHITYTPDAQALRLNRSERFLSTAGLVLTFLSMACMVTALVRRESGWYLFLGLLLCFDLSVPLLL